MSYTLEKRIFEAYIKSVVKFDDDVIGLKHTNSPSPIARHLAVSGHKTDLTQSFKGMMDEAKPKLPTQPDGACQRV